MRKLACILIFVTYTCAKTIQFWDPALFLLPFRLKNIITTIPVSNSCVTQLISVLQGIRSERIWALEMLDATAKPMPGLLTGNMQQIGNYDQCLNISRKIKENQIIRGKYCTAVAYQAGSKTPLSLASFSEYTKFKLGNYEDRAAQFLFTWDFCIPAACSINDLQLIVRTVVKRWNFKYLLQFSEDLCDYKDKQQNYNSVDYFAMVFLGGYFALIASCTLLDILHDRISTNEPSLIRAFSLYSNMKSLMFSRPVEDTLTCIFGLKAIGMMWIVIGHHFLLSIYMPAFYGLNKIQFLEDTKNSILVGSTFSVETFFVITGFLVTYNVLKVQERGVKVTIGHLYLHRILRLLPALAVMILLYSSLLRFVGDGPLWPVWKHVVYDSCRKSWWWSLLFIQNYNKTDRCAHHGWYLSVDTQLYALSPLFLFQFFRHPRRVITVLLCLIVMAITSTFVISWTNNAGVSFLHDKTENLLYLQTHLRAPSYLLGSILGYVVFASRFTPFKIDKVLVRILWIASLSLLVYVPYIFFAIGRLDKPTVLQASLINSLCRPVWGLCMCWIIYACIMGYGKAVNQFLSLPFFTFISRVTYSMYLTHMMTMQIIMYQNRGPQYFTNLYLYRSAIGDYVIVCLVAIAWNLCFESPILVVEKLLTGRGIQKMLKAEKCEKFTTGEAVDKNLVD